jgi:hypothetical protein
MSPRNFHMEEKRMAGLMIDDRMPRVISAKTHGIIDYIHAATNILAGVAFRKRSRRASNAAFLMGAGVLANALMTDYPLGVFRLYSFKVHGILDYGVAATSAALPEMLRLRRTSVPAQYFYGQGAGETVIAGISNYDDESGSRLDVRRLQRDVWRTTRRAA